MATAAAALLPRVAQLNADYARAIDDDRLEDWPGFFAARCLYKITSADNHRRGLPQKAAALRLDNWLNLDRFHRF